MRITTVACAASLLAAPAWPAPPSHSLAPLEVRVALPPTPVTAGGATHLVYELRITSFDKRPRELEILDLAVSDESGRVLARWAGAELADVLVRPAVKPPLDSPRRLGLGSHRVAFLWVTLPVGGAVPAALTHELNVTSEGWSRSLPLRTPPVEVVQTPAAPVGPPLRGSGWLAGNGPSNGTGADQHRRGISVLDGVARSPERFAVDWIRFEDDGKLVSGDPLKNESWSAYGAEVLAVGDGVVALVQDGVPDNVPGSIDPALTPEQIYGNLVVVDLGDGRFAGYSHLIPDSVRVREGERVRRGQVLARLGNSGSSDAPHLHFQLTDGPHPHASEGLPFVFHRHRRLGRIEISDDLLEVRFSPGQPLHEILSMPLEGDVIDFEE